jgi:hypothetical protein
VTRNRRLPRFVYLFLGTEGWREEGETTVADVEEAMLLVRGGAPPDEIG